MVISPNGNTALGLISFYLLATDQNSVNDSTGTKSDSLEIRLTITGCVNQAPAFEQEIGNIIISKLTGDYDEELP